MQEMQEMQETRVWFLCQEHPLEKGVATHSRILAWEIPWMEEPGGLQSVGSDMIERARCVLQVTLSVKWCLCFFNTLSRFVIAFLPRNKCLNFMTAVTVHTEFRSQENKICHCFHFSPFICREVMGLDPMILVFWMLSFKPAFSLFSFTFIKRLFSFLHFLP